MKHFFRIISAVFSPLVVPVYALVLALWASPLRILPSGTLLGVAAVCTIIVTVAPASAVFLLHKAGIISDPGLNLRRERTLPYCIAMACYLIASYYLFRIMAPGWITGIMTGGFATIAVNMLVNFRWKISGHMAAMGGLIAVVFFMVTAHTCVINMIYPAVASILLSGLVGTARLGLDRHTPMQLLAGTANGFACVYASCAILNHIQPSIF